MPSFIYSTLHYPKKSLVYNLIFLAAQSIQFKWYIILYYFLYYARIAVNLSLKSSAHFAVFN